LEAIHYYSAEFYEKQGLADCCRQQFDGTALVAMGTLGCRGRLILGIIVEELVRDCLGKDGYKVFMEENVDECDNIGGNGPHDALPEGHPSGAENSEANETNSDGDLDDDSWS
jgi:hypothetical protein